MHSKPQAHDYDFLLRLIADHESGARGKPGMMTSQLDAEFLERAFHGIGMSIKTQVAGVRTISGIVTVLP